jgi:tetratricopeptide (TPR) repeat protein
MGGRSARGRIRGTAGFGPRYRETVVDDDESGDGVATALLVAPVNTSRLAVARSLADAAPGELVIVDRRGQTMSRRQVTVMKAASWATVVASGAFVGIAYGALFSSPLAGVIAGVAFEALTLRRLRHWPAFRAAMAQVASYRWEEAHAALLALEGKRLQAGQRRTVQVVLAALESILGQPQQALERLARARADLSTWQGSSRVLRCQAAAIRAGVLATLGRFEQARAALDELVREATAATGSAGRQRGDYLEMLVQSTELKIAADADTPEALPDDDTLHRWARAALGRTKFGDMLVSLAWAFQRRGDDDLARHLLAEAPSRIPRSSLATTSPRLAAWAAETARAWGVEGYARAAS